MTKKISSKKVSLVLVGLIWLLVGVGLGIRGINWIMELGIGPKTIGFLSLSVIFGLLKGKYILKKVAMKYWKRSESIQFKEIDILSGWIKILGIRGFIFIGIMIAIGILLRNSNIDRPILGVVYLAVGFALVYASKIFFEEKRNP